MTVVLTLPVAIGVALRVATVAEAQSSRATWRPRASASASAPTGPTPTSAGHAEPGPFTDWMTAEIDRDRRRRRTADHRRPPGRDPDDPDIQLRVMTTNLTLGRPQTFPFKDRTYLFDPLELAATSRRRSSNASCTARARPRPETGSRCSPRRATRRSRLDDPPRRNAVPARRAGCSLALRWLSLDRPDRPRPAPPSTATVRSTGCRRPSELPVILAARLSLSFPALISAVPLWAMDYTDNVGTRGRPALSGQALLDDRRRAHGELPGALLRLAAPGPADVRRRPAELPRSIPGPGRVLPGPGQSGLQPRFRTITSVQGFAAGLLDTMQYWADNAQATLPGYRDRIVQVRLRPDEGGMNLQMPDDVVRRAAEKGRQAAEALRERFDFDDHRWIRYLTMIGRMQQTVDLMESRAGTLPLPGGAPGYHDFVRDRAAEPVRPHPRRGGRRR